MFSVVSELSNSSWEGIVGLTTIAICLVIGRTLWRICYNIFFHPLAKFPGPLTAAVTDWWEIYHVIKCDRFYVIQALHEQHGAVVRIGPNHISVASPETFHTVFVTKCSSFLKSEFYSTIQPGVGPKFGGLFNFTDHKKAMAERKDLQPSFSPTSLRQYEARYVNQLDLLVIAMKAKKEVDMFQLFKFLLLDAVGDLAFDQSFNQLTSGKDHQYVIDFNNAFMLIGLQNTFSWLIPCIPYLPFQSLKDAYYGLQRVFIYSQAQVKRYLEQSTSKKQGTLISAYLDPEIGNPKPGYSPWSIAIAGHGFIIAGSEASSITLTYMLWILTKNPSIETRLRSELATIPSNYSSADVAKLPYLDAVLRETLRVYPPAPSPMPRVTPAEGATIEGVEFPPNVVISAQPYTIHRSSTIFENPEVFNPDRWLNISLEKKEEMNKAFIPFSAGQRGCLGRGLAWMHMQLALVKCLEHFDRFELGEEMSDDDMLLIERGALAKPKATKLWVKCYEKKEPGLSPSGT